MPSEHMGGGNVWNSGFGISGKKKKKKDAKLVDHLSELTDVVQMQQRGR